MLASTSYWTYLRIVIDYRWMDPWFHGEELCKFLEDLEESGDDGLALVWRGAGKSGMITEPMPAWWLAKNPYKRVGVANATGDGAARMIRTSAAIVSGNGAFKRCFPDCVPSSKWGEDGYYLDVASGDDTFGTRERKIPSLSAYGVRGNITGAHFDGGFIFDDLLNEETADSATHRRRVEKFFGEMCNTIDLGAPLRGCCTRWTYDDYCGKIESGELQSKQGRLRIFKVGVTTYDHAKKKQVLVAPHRKWYDDLGNEYGYGETEESLVALKKANGHRFSALYYNEPVMDDDIQFDIQKIQTFPTLPPPFELGPVARVGVECESQSAALMSTIDVMMRQEGRKIAIDKLTTQKKNKHDRIRSVVQPAVYQNQLCVRRDLMDRDDNLGQELRTFDKGSDDCLDALTYGIELCKGQKDDIFPMVHIAVDPAFTDETYSDHTAILAITRFQDQFWVLDCMRFQTNRADYIVRMIFAMFDKMQSFSFEQSSNKKRSKKIGFRSSRSVRHNRPKKGGWSTNESFDIDLTGYQRKRELEGR